ncbi:MAG: ABC transporter ATP-binding protein [Flavobacteriaceae bacterium]
MLQVKNVSFQYHDSPVLRNISFDLEQGEYLAIIGASGCGKSTLLEIIYGLLHIDHGELFYKKQKLKGPRFKLVPGESFMKYLPQDFDLMPYTTVAENVGAFLSNIFPEKKRSRVMELLDVVEMQDFSEIKVKYLSGGQKQRVALARVLAKEPKVMLLDEPFSHIDNFRKNSLRRKVFSYLKSKNITCIVATHDTTDALAFADQTLLIQDHEILAQDTPESLYNDPGNKFVASFFSDVSQLPSTLWDAESEQNEYIFYPHDLCINSKGFKVRVIDTFFKGSHYLIQAKTSSDLEVFFQHDVPFEIDSEITIAPMRFRNINR